MNFIILYFANLVLDYPLQDSFIKEWKQKNNYILFVHCAIWGLGLSIVTFYLGLFAWWKVIMLVLGHYIIDYWKCRRVYKLFPKKKVLAKPHIKGYKDKYTKVPIISDIISLYIDQFLHVLQIILCLL